MGKDLIPHDLDGGWVACLRLALERSGGLSARVDQTHGNGWTSWRAVVRWPGGVSVASLGWSSRDEGLEAAVRICESEGRRRGVW